MSIYKDKSSFETDRSHYNFLRIWQRRYAHMLARHEGRATKHSSSQGKGIMSQEEFFAWCKEFENLQAFVTIYFEWAQNDFVRWWSPSIDRKDPKKGYVTGNIQWLSFSENCEKNDKDPMEYHKVSSYR